MVATDRARWLMLRLLLGSKERNDEVAPLENLLPALEHAEQTDSIFRDHLLWAHVLLARHYQISPDADAYALHCDAIQRMLDSGVGDTMAKAYGSSFLISYHAISGNMEAANVAAHTTYRLAANAPFEDLVNSAFLTLSFLKYSMGETDSALLYAREGLTVARQRNFHYMENRAANIIGYVLHDRNDLEGYLAMTDSALMAIIPTGSKLLIANAHQQKANALNKLGMFSQAISVAEKGLSYTPQDPLVQKELLRVLVLAADSLNDHDVELKYLHQLSAVKDTLIILEQTEAFARLNSKYESEKKDLEIERLKTEKFRSEIRSQRLLLLCIVVVLLLMLFSGIALAVYHHRKRMAENRLLNERLEAGHAMLKAVEEERSRISMILHDSVAGSLSGMNHLVDYISDLQKQPEKQLEELKSLGKRLQTAYNQVRDLSHELLPTMPDSDRDMAEQLAQFIDNRFGHLPFKISVVLEHGKELNELNEAEQMLAFRFVQESMNNASKHAQAAELTVQSALKRGQLSLSVADNGVGMQENEGGIGLQNLRKHATAMHAQLQVHSKMNEGTQLELQFSREN